MFGLGSAFLLAGVANYVGTFWVVHDTESLDFATACYRRLAAGGRLGDALQAARTAVAATHGAQAITWASYVHYGDPAYRPFPVGVDAQPSVPRATRNASLPASPCPWAVRPVRPRWAGPPRPRTSSAAPTS